MIIVRMLLNKNTDYYFEKNKMITFDEFVQIDIRTGTIIAAEEFPAAMKRAYKLVIDFGSEIGIKRSSAQITSLYTLQQLIGKQILAVVNLPPKKIADFISEVLVLGLVTNQTDVVLIGPDISVANGVRLS
jgi:tRNA-binding protein